MQFSIKVLSSYTTGVVDKRATMTLKSRFRGTRTVVNPPKIDIFGSLTIGLRSLPEDGVSIRSPPLRRLWHTRSWRRLHCFPRINFSFYAKGSFDSVCGVFCISFNFDFRKGCEISEKRKSHGDGLRFEGRNQYGFVLEALFQRSEAESEGSGTSTRPVLIRLWRFEWTLASAQSV